MSSRRERLSGTECSIADGLTRSVGGWATQACRANSASAGLHAEPESSLLATVKERKDAPLAKITSKYQVSVPKAIAEQYGLRPGDEIEWVAEGEVIRVIPAGQDLVEDTIESRLRLFDEATKRHAARVAGTRRRQPRSRGWTREDLYSRGRID